MESILVVAPFASVPGEPYFSRYLHLCYLWAKDYRVTLVTSSFRHWTKLHRDRQSPNLADLPFELVLLDEPGYQRHVSFARFWSHRRFHDEFKTWLLTELEAGVRFDLIYSAFPLISTNLTLGKLKSQYGYKLVIDVQDIWPDSIFVALPFLAKAPYLLSPIRAKAYQAYGYADGLIAVSKTYLAVARRHCPKTPGQVTYLGSDYQMIETAPARALAASKRRLVYIGTLSYSYDLTTVIRGFSQLATRYPNLELHILGDGPDRDRLEKIAAAGVFFHGFVAYDEMLSFVKACDLTINPIVGKATQSVTNKLSDYIALGLPILSSQENWEAIELIKRRQGYLFEAGSPESFARAAEQAIAQRQSESQQPIEQQERAYDEIDRLFDRRVTYPQITEFLESIYSGSAHSQAHISTSTVSESTVSKSTFSASTISESTVSKSTI